MSDLVYVPSCDDESYVKLARTQQGKLYRKKILPINKPFIHPANPAHSILVTPEVAASLVKNFGDNVVEHVQTTVVNKDNQHSEDPRDNVGEVIGLDYDENGVYATIDARKHEDEFGKTFLDSSAFLHMDYTDTNTGAKVGPTLLHVAVTNRGHVRDMGDYEKVLSASADNKDEKILFLSEAEPESAPAIEETPVVETETDEDLREEPTPEEESSEMTREEAIALLKSEGIDVEALQSEAERAAELSAQLDDVNNQLALSGEKINDVTELAEAVVSLTNSNKALSDDIESLKLSNANYAKRDAENEVDALIRAGKVLPAQKDVMVKLSMSDRETFDALVPENPIVKLSESGTATHEEPGNSKYSAEDLERYKSLAARLSRPAN